MLTARATLEDKLQGFRCGADDYVDKPFAFEELLARLGVLVRRSAGADRLEIGRLSIDLRARAAWIGQDRLALRPREFDVLLLLAQNPGRTVTRDELIDAAWQGAEVTENAVDVYVGYVRKRLAGHADAPHLDTVRGVGYRLAGV